jgi:hypothetical protein
LIDGLRGCGRLVLSSVHNPASIRACSSFWNLGRLACLHLGDDAIKSGRANRSQHTAVTRYRYFSCLGTVFLHRLFLELFLGQALCRLHRQKRELK